MLAYIVQVYKFTLHMHINWQYRIYFSTESMYLSTAVCTYLRKYTDLARKQKKREQIALLLVLS